MDTSTDSRPIPPSPAQESPVASRVRRESLELTDGYATGLYVHPPPPDAPQRTPVLYVHGIQSHPGWFVGSADALAARGRPVWQVVRRGSGENTVGRGHAESAGLLLDDLEVAARRVLQAEGAERVALVGVSWGGKLAAAYAIHPQRRVEIASLTLVAPGIVPRVDVPLTTKLAIGLALLVSPHRRFDIPLGDPALFTDSEAMREYLQADPLRLQRATARFLYAGRCLDVELRRADDGSLAVPCTLLLASRDRIIDNDATRRAVQRLAADAAHVVTLDGSHTLEFETDPTGFHETLCRAVAAAQ